MRVAASGGNLQCARAGGGRTLSTAGRPSGSSSALHTRDRGPRCSSARSRYARPRPGAAARPPRRSCTWPSRTAPGQPAVCGACRYAAVQHGRERLQQAGRAHSKVCTARRGLSTHQLAASTPRRPQRPRRHLLRGGSADGWHARHPHRPGQARAAARAARRRSASAAPPPPRSKLFDQGWCMRCSVLYMNISNFKYSSVSHIWRGQMSDRDPHAFVLIPALNIDAQIHFILSYRASNG